MKPEKGDKRIKVTRKEVAAGVAAVGVRPGDIVMFHSSLSSMGTVIGGADTINRQSKKSFRESERRA